MKVVIDTTSGHISLSIDGSPAATMTASQAHQLIDQLAAAAADVEQVPPAFDPGHASSRNAAGSWAWYCNSTPDARCVIALRHPLLGWISNVMPPPEAVKLGGLLNYFASLGSHLLVLGMAKKLSEQPGAVDTPIVTPGTPAGGSGSLH